MMAVEHTELVSHIAKAIDVWHADHPDLTVVEIIDACDYIAEKLTFTHKEIPPVLHVIDGGKM